MSWVLDVVFFKGTVYPIMSLFTQPYDVPNMHGFYFFHETRKEMLEYSNCSILYNVGEWGWVL